MKKIFTFLVTLSLLIVSQVVRGQEELTVYENATATSTQVPVHGTWTDAYLKCEFVIPADQLEDMDGGTISQMTFYLTTPAGAAWTGTFQVFLMEVDNTTISAYYGPDNATVVYEGSLDATQSTMDVEFNESYTYGGGNLLIGVYQIVKGNYKTATFAGESISGASVQGYSGSSLDAVTVNQRNFIPKTKFTYTPDSGGGPVCEKPTDITASQVTPNSATVSWTGDGSAFNLQYKTSSSTDWTEVNGLSDLSYNLTSLVSNTTYTVRVQQVCNENTSNWKNTSFTTPIGIPLFEPFDATDIPTGWKKYIGSLGTDGTANLTSTMYGSWTFGSSNGVFDNHAMIQINYTNFYWLVSPILHIEDNVGLSFDMALTAYSGTLGAPATNGSDDKFVVLITTDGGSTWEILRQWDNAGSEYVYNNITCSAEGESVSIDLSNYADQNIAIAFYGESTQYNADNKLHIDNVRIDYSNILSCKRPTGLSATDVTPYSATLSWNENGTATAWQLCLNEDTINLITADTNPFTLVGLTPGTTYTVRVRSYCDSIVQSLWASITFTTPLVIPFVETFDSTGVPAGWTLSGSSWSFGNANGAFDRHAYAYMQRTPYYSSINKWLISPVVRIEDGVKLSFDMALTSNVGTLAPPETSSSDKFMVQITTDGGNTWEILRQWDNNGSEYVYNNIPCTAEGESVSIVLSSYAGQNIAVAFYVESTLGSTVHTLHIDNVHIDYGLSCKRPTEISITDIDTNSATVTWTGEGSAFNLQYKTSNATDWTEVGGLSGFSYNLTGLTSNTTYNVRVQQVCDEDTSSWRTATFTTPMILPLVEPFDAGSIPAGWTSTYWHFSNADGVFNNHAYCYTGYARLNAWLVSPAVRMENGVFLSFDMALTSAMGTLGTPQGGARDKFEVLITADGGNTWEILRQWDNMGSEYVYNNIPCSADGENVSLDLSNYAGQNIAIAFYVETLVNPGSNDLHIDNVRIDYGVPCTRPTGLAAADVAVTTATLSWTESGMASAWQVCLNDDTINLVTADTNPFTLVGLTEGTIYTAKVRANCGSSNYSDWSIPVTFTTCRTFTSEFEATICENALPYTWNDSSYFESGDYTQTFLSVANCDSVVTLHLTVLPPPAIEIARVAEFSATTCEGFSTAIEAVVTGGYGEIASYQWLENGFSPSGDGENRVLNIGDLTPGADDLYTVEVVQTGSGCYNSASAALDTLVTVYPKFAVSVSGPASVCDNGTLTLTATMENTSEDDNLTYQWYKIMNYATIGITETDVATYTETELQAGSYNYWVKVSGNVSGCSALANTDQIIIFPISSTALFDTICDGDNYEFFGDTLTEAGPYTHTLQAANGCDSVITLHLTVHPIPAVTSIDETICGKALPYMWNDSAYTESGDYTQTLPNVNNCDSTVNLHLTVLPSLVGELTTMAPIAGETVSNYPVHFSWNAVENASTYDLYVWSAGEPQPQQPTASQIHGTQYNISELPNNSDYQWFVKTYNECDTVTSTIRPFSLSVSPTLTVTSGNPVDFGEVPFNSTRSVSFNVTGTALDSPITYQLSGADASSFSLAPTNNWDSLHGGRMQLTFHPTVPQGNYTAQMTFQSGNLVETVTVTGALSNYYTFTTYVDSNIYAMDSEIPIHGQVTDPLDAPIAGVNVEVYVKVMDYVRTIPAISDANGQFTVTFTPQHSEAGYYTVGSRRAGGNSTAEHDDFNIPGMMRTSSDWILWSPTLDQADTGVIAVRNRSQLPLTNIQVTPVSLPNGCTVQFLPLTLAGMATGELQYIVSGSATSTGVNYEEVPLHAASAEGATMDFSAWYYCIPQRADLDVMPKSLVTTMTRGKSKVVDFMIYNNGTGSTGNIIVSLPFLPWMSVVGGDTLPPLAAHDSAYVSIRLSADSATELVRYTGNFAIQCERGEGVSIPYNITAISDSTGTLVVDVTDEYAWNTNGGHGPHLAGANVTVKGYYSLETVATGVTDANGLFVADNLPEGWYRLIIRASRHAEYQNYLYITAGDTNLQDIFIPFQAITYSWDVVPTEIEDVYTYELNVDFETHVPKPVVTMDIDRTLPLLEDCEMGEFNVLATNHGLVAAMDVSVVVPQSDYFVFTPLVSHIDSLPALTTYTIPVTYQRKDCAQQVHLMFASNVHTKAKTKAKAKAPDYYDGITCNKNMFNLTYWYFCRITHWETVISGDVKYDRPQESCGDSLVMPDVNVQPVTPSPGPTVTDFGGDIVINPDWVRNYPYINLPNLTGYQPGVKKDSDWVLPNILKFCDPNLTPCQNALNGISGCVPVLPSNMSIDSHNEISISTEGELVDKAKDDLMAMVEYYGTELILDLFHFADKMGCVASILYNYPNIKTCIQSWTNPYTAAEIRDRDIATLINICRHLAWSYVKNPDFQEEPEAIAEPNSNNVILKKKSGVMAQISGTSATNIHQLSSPNQSNAIFHEGYITDAGRAQILAECLGIEDSPEVEEFVNAFVDRWNHSMEAWDSGYFTAADAPDGYDTNFIQLDTNLLREFHELNGEAVSQGYANIFERFDGSVTAFQNALEEYQENQNSSSLCATVTVQFTQRMTMTREAFEGTLTIDNGHESLPIQDIDIDFVIRDENGVDCTNLFQINFLSYNNMTGTNGNASLDAQSEGSIIVQFIPTKQAAPEIAKVYSFGGTLSFTDPFTGEYMNNSLYPVDIWVHPSPDLYVNYFMQRDILGDDPLTEEKVEPIVPAELGVIIHNRGAGIAKNVILETAEPRIIDNEKGLAIDFAMYGAAFNGNERQLGLMAIPFGNIEPNRAAVGEWWFTSTLLGHFVSYEAHVIHNSSFGNPDLSLVSSLQIHPLIHTVYAYGNLDDGINDFLVDDVDDYRHYPDSLYFSNGSRTAVSIADSISFDHYVTPLDTIVQLTLDPSRIGWNYEQTWDPGQGQYKLISCTRNSDQQVIPLSNVWQSFVTLPVGGDPVYENRLHIVDTLNTDQPTTYTLVFSLHDLVLEVDTIMNVPDSIITAPLSEVTVKFNKPIVDSTFNYLDMRLKCNNGENLLDENLNVERMDSMTYKLHLAPYAYQSGYYVLTIQTLDITDMEGFNGYYAEQATWIQNINTCQPDSVSITDTVCDSYQWAGVTYYESGDITRTFYNTAGCDSVVTLHLTVENCDSGDENSVVVTITGHHKTTSYDGAVQTVSGYDVIISNPLYTEADFTFGGDSSAARLELGTTYMGLAESQFTNINPNFDTVTFIVIDGYQTIVPADVVVVTITGHHSAVTYDGAEHSVSGYDVEIGNPLYTEADFTFNGTNTAQRTDAGTTSMGLAADQFTNTSSNFETVLFDITDGYQTVMPRVITLTSASDNREYNGNWLTNHNVAVEGEGFVNGEGATYNVTGQQLLPGSSNNTFTYTLNTGTLADNYTITRSFGALTVTDRSEPYGITMTSNSNAEPITYDGQEHTVSGFETHTFTTPDGNTYAVTGLTASVTGIFAGEYENVIAGADTVKDEYGNIVTEQFAVSHAPGVLNISKRPISFTIAQTADASKMYDGTPLTVSYNQLHVEGLASTDTLVAGTITTDDYEIGDYPIVDGNMFYTMAAGSAVKSGFKIKHSSGELAKTLASYTPSFDITLSITDVPECQGVTYQGHDYDAVQIGSQCWLAENLRNTVDANGNPIANYRAVDNDPANVEKYGYLYSWYSAVGVEEDNVDASPLTFTADDGTTYVRGICPVGWGVPSQSDFLELNASVGSTALLKDPSTEYWLLGFEGVAGGTGFNARGGGRYNALLNRYEDQKTAFHFWKSDSTPGAISIVSACVAYYCDQILLAEPNQKNDGKNVRCIRKNAH